MRRFLGVATVLLFALVGGGPPSTLAQAQTYPSSAQPDPRFPVPCQSENTTYHPPCVSATSCGTLCDSLVSYWPLDEVAGQRNDTKGTNHLTDNNTVASAAGKHNNAASFVAANSEYLDIAAQVLPVNGDFTVAFWAKHTETDGLNRNVFPFKTKAGAIDQHGIFLEATWVGGFYRYYNRRAFGTSINLGYNGNTWVLYFYEYVHATTTTRCMAMGSALNSGIWSAGSVADLGAATNYFSMLSPEASSLDNPWVMDEFAIWSRVLIADERTELWNAGAGKFYDGTKFAYLLLSQPWRYAANDNWLLAKPCRRFVRIGGDLRCAA